MWELTIHIAIIINLAHCILTICKYAGVIPLEEEESASNSAGCVKSVSVHSQSSQELPECHGLDVHRDTYVVEVTSVSSRG